MNEKTEFEGQKRDLRSAIILTGGKGRRLGTVEKALIEFEGKTILERLLENLFRVVDEVILSVRDTSQKEKLIPVREKFPGREIRFCFDTLEDAGPLEGIRAGLLESRSEYSFVCAGDMPFVKAEVVDLLFEKACGHDAAISRWNERMFEPLHSVYSRKMLQEIENAFERGKHSVLSPVFQMKDVVFVEVSEIREIDPELRTFVNINTVEDLESMIGYTVEKVEL